MKDNKLKVEVEGGELALKNSHGDIVIIPKDSREEILSYVDEECWDCIDNFVEGLPLLEDYAEDGSLIPVGEESFENGDPVSKYRPTKESNPDTVYNSIPALQLYAVDPNNIVNYKRRSKVTLPDGEDYVTDFGEDDKGTYVSFYKSGGVSKMKKAFGAVPEESYDRKYFTVPSIKPPVKGEFDPGPREDKAILAHKKKYIQSPKYKEKLIKMGYSDPDKVVKERVERLDKVSVFNVEGDKLQSHYYPKDNEIVMDNKQLKKSKLDAASVFAHEAAHTTGARQISDTKGGGNKNSKFMSEREFTELQSRNKLKDSKVKHHTKSSEFKSDIDALRYLMDRDGTYDSTKDTFDEQHIEKLKKDYKGNTMIQRLLEKATDEDLIWLMNNIAKNESKSSNKGMA